LSGRASILVVGDDRALIDPLTHRLIDLGLKAVGSYDADSALLLAETRNPSAVVMSLDLRVRTGRELLQELARRGQAGVIVLGTSGAQRDVALAFDLGAEDYLAPPISFRELLARINASLRRAKIQQRMMSSPSPREDILRAGHLVLDGVTTTASYALQPLYLTPTEFRILEQLVIHSEKVVESRILLRRVWGRYRVDQGRVVSTAMCRLRGKLRAVGAGELVETRRGVGFLLRAERAGDRLAAHRPSQSEY
jgi:two-component system OmpR family response regulator